MSMWSKAVLWFGGFLILWHCTLAAFGHDAGGWNYPSICCHDADCAPVEWQGETPDHKGVANTKLHAGITIDPAPYIYKLPSPDGKMHICATPDKSMAPNMTRRYYCIFNPEGM